VPIGSFPDYVAAVAFNAFDEHLRRAFPHHARMKNRIRYVLRRDPRFSLWNVGLAIVGGRAGWEGTEAATALPAIDFGAGGDLAAALLRIFDAAGRPVAVDLLVSVLTVVFDAPRAPQAAEPVAPEPSAFETIERTQRLRRLWAEIALLPQRQRIALLLSARDSSGESISRLLPLLGIATVRELARTVGMDDERFADLWPGLPLDDNAIAALLGTKRQQVINLRKSARVRLLRRMSREERKP